MLPPRINDQTKSDVREFCQAHANADQSLGLFKNAQMVGARKTITGAYTQVREDCGRSGKHHRWAFFDSSVQQKLGQSCFNAAPTDQSHRYAKKMDNINLPALFKPKQMTN